MNMWWDPWGTTSARLDTLTLKMFIVSISFVDAQGQEYEPPARRAMGTAFSSWNKDNVGY